MRWYGASVNPTLQEFLETAQALAHVSGFDRVELGVVHTNTEPRLVLALRAVLVRASEAPQGLEPVQTSVVSGSRQLLPLNVLPDLLEALSNGIVPAGRELGFSHPLQLSLNAGQGIAWSRTRKSRLGTLHAEQASARPGDLPKLLAQTKQDQDQIERTIGPETGYRFASLARVIKAFTQVTWSPASPSPEIDLYAPWPVHEISSKPPTKELTVDVIGLTGLSPARFILNIEGQEKDVRPGNDEVHWIPIEEPTPGMMLYRARVTRFPEVVTAVNLFIENLPAVSLRAEFKEANAWDTFLKQLKEIQEPPSAPESSWEPLRITYSSAPKDLRFTQFRASSYRLLRAVQLDLEQQPLAVLVGPNQSGKSTVLDALQLLADAALGRLEDALVRKRGGLLSIQSRGADASPVTLEADFKDATGGNHRYGLQLRAVGTHDFAVEEALSSMEHGRWNPVLTRSLGSATIAGTQLQLKDPHETVLWQIRGAGAAILGDVAAALSHIAIYPYFQTGAGWASPEKVPMRLPGQPQARSRLDPSGGNLTAALLSIREEQPEDWAELVQVLKLVFPRFHALVLRPVARGTLQLEWEDEGGARFDASELSDGTMGLLATLCALYQRGRSLIAIDEPEQHLHPDALLRLVGVAQSVSARQPVLFTTQSDALIGLLDETPDAVVIARRDEEGTQLVRPKLSELQEWLKTFSLRDMRRELEGWNPPS